MVIYEVANEYKCGKLDIVEENEISEETLFFLILAGQV
jgi:hypothetical protein